MATLMQAVNGLHDQGVLPRGGSVSVRDLSLRFRPVPPGSVRSLLSRMLAQVVGVFPTVSRIRPMYRRSRPKPQKIGDFATDKNRIDLRNAHLKPYGESDPVARANELFDTRAAAAINAAVGIPGQVKVLFPTGSPQADPDKELLETKIYKHEAPGVRIPKAKCLAAIAFADYFPDYYSSTEPYKLRRMVSEAILAANPGWCGTFGPGVDAATDLATGYEGDYDMAQMHLLQIAYRYYDELTPEAREHLITVLLARGRVHRPRLDDTFTSGRTPEDWSRAGFVSPLGMHNRIGETENHILMILTARYLTNQLLYQRDPDLKYDNRRNGTKWVDGQPRRVGPDCTGLLLTLLRWMLMNDFSEYNAKPYQRYTRLALLNLCGYAYDHEIRLAARMVLDYISARIAVSSNDLRRLVPFRRRNAEPYITHFNVTDFDGRYMGIGLLEEGLGADPMAEHFAIQAGNTRAYETPSPERPWPWGIASDGGEATKEALSDYRLPPSIHDLFLNDSHRRFFQRLHRFVQPDISLTCRNCDNMEIYAGSPSYLITAGGRNAGYAIDPEGALRFESGRSKNRQQLGVAVTTSFMPTGLSAGPGTQNRARDLIQFSCFSDGLNEKAEPEFPVENYGVAPDFACGHQVYLPGWVVDATLMQAVKRLRNLGELPTDGPVSLRALHQRFDPFPRGSVRSVLYKMREIMAEHLEPDPGSRFIFVDRGARPGGSEPAGFYLAIYRDKNRQFAFLEAFDTWFDPTLTFEEFKKDVDERSRNINAAALSFQNNVSAQYTTRNGNTLHFVIWRDIRILVDLRTYRGQHPPVGIKQFNPPHYGAKITKIDYGRGNPVSTLRHAGNDTSKYLSGTIMNSPAEAVVEITNPFLGTKIILDMSDPWHPKRTSEKGEVEEAGSNHEVWVDFTWVGPSEGDFFRPFNTLAAAVAAVADGGVIKIMPGSTRERHSIPNNKRIRLVAPIGGVTIGGI